MAGKEVTKKVVDMRVYEIEAEDKKQSRYRLPDQNIAEEDKKPQWYVDNTKYIASFYNTRQTNINSIPQQSSTTTAIDNNINDIYKGRPVYEMLRYMQYYNGEQQNLDYNHLTENVTASNLQAVWIKGQKIASLVDFLIGNARQKLSNAEWSAVMLSEKATSARTDMFSDLMLKVLLKPIFEKLAEQGAEFNPGNGAKMEFPEDVKKWMAKNYKEQGAEIAMDIAKGLWHQEQWLNKFTQIFKNLAITGVAAVEHSVDNGKAQVSPIMPYNLILDTRVDEDYNRKGRFRGKVEPMTPTAIFKKWPELSDKQRSDIEEMASNHKMGNEYNTTDNIKWWITGSYNSDPTITTVTVYWQGVRDMGLKKKKNQYGEDRVVETTDKERGDYQVVDIQKATLIGNRYLVDFGYVDNLVEDYDDKAIPLFPIQVFMPNMTLGETKSVVCRLHKLQDELDALEFKVREMIGAAKGKGYFVHGWKLGGTVTAQEMMNDLSSIGVHVLNSTGEAIDMSDNQKVVEMVDLTLDPNIQQIYALIEKKNTALEEIVNISKIAMGQQQFYVGQATQQSSLGQSSLGLAYLYDGFMDFVQQNMQYSCNVAKNLYTMEDSMNVAVTIGDKGRKYLQITKDFKFEDFLIYMSIRDIVDPESKARLLTIAQALAQNDKIDMLDFIEIETATTFTEIKSLLEYSVAKRKKEDDDKRKEQEAIQAQEAEKNRQAQMAMVQQQSQAGIQKTQDQVQGKMAETVLKQHGEAQQQAADQQQPEGQPA